MVDNIIIKKIVKIKVEGSGYIHISYDDAIELIDKEKMTCKKHNGVFYTCVSKADCFIYNFEERGYDAFCSSCIEKCLKRWGEEYIVNPVLCLEFDDLVITTNLFRMFIHYDIDLGYYVYHKEI